jgi:hypothetical protein
MRLMGVNGQAGQGASSQLQANGKDDGQAKLDWTDSVLSAEDVRTRLNGRPEIVVRSNTIITPAASDELRRHGVRISRESSRREPASFGRWAYAQERHYPVVIGVMQSLKREGVDIEAAQVSTEAAVCHWARELAESVGRGSWAGVLAFCEDAGLVCCVANKVRGIRATASGAPRNCLSNTHSLGANFIGIEVAGRTFFELKQTVRLACRMEQPKCLGEVARVIGELEGYAHR